MTDISGAMEAARELVANESSLELMHKRSIILRALQVSRALIASHPQRDGEGNRGSEPQVPAPALTSDAIDGIVHLVGRDVAELPDRTSPDDQPDMMQVTADELEDAVRAALHAFLAYAPSPVDPWRPISTAPKDGKVIVGMFTCSLKFKLYAKESAEYKRGIAGRWQIPRGEHGGWQNLHDWIPVAWSRADANQQSKTGGGEEK